MNERECYCRTYCPMWASGRRSGVQVVTSGAMGCCRRSRSRDGPSCMSSILRSLEARGNSFRSMYQICRGVTCAYMCTPRQERDSPMFTRLTRRWRGEDERLRQLFRATHSDTLRDHLVSAMRSCPWPRLSCTAHAGPLLRGDQHPPGSVGRTARRCTM